MKFLSVCSGIEAASVAWNPIGWKAAALSEIEPFPCALLSHHYPDVPNRGDMTKFQEWPDAAIDLLCGGTPCQSFSVAGLRKGLDDPRGNLMLTFGAIAGRYRPRWLVWENVAGVLSSNGGRDFGAFLGLLGILGYGFAYRLFDAQYFGVAQRRRRVFVVGYLGDWRPAAAVLFERHSLQGNSAPSRKARKDTAHELAPCIGASGRGLSRAGETRGQDPVVAVSHTLRGEGFDASEDGTGRGTPLVLVPHASVSPGLKARDFKGPSSDGDGDGAILIPVAFNLRGREGGAMPELSDVASIRAASGGSSRSYAMAFHGIQDPDVSGDVTHPMARNHGQEQAEMVGARVRSLTPRECERLQGFQDDYTAIPYRGKVAADGPRYKALGNSWAVPCARWIGERIDLVESVKVAA